MKPDFEKINIDSFSKPKDSNADWEANNNIHPDWKTSENIDIKPV